MSPARGITGGLGLAGAAALAAVAGVLLPAVLFVLSVGALVMLAAPVLSAYALVGLAQMDGIALLVDRHLPLSMFKLLSAALLATLLVTLRTNPMLQQRPRLSMPLLATLLFAIWIVISHLLSPWMDAGSDHTKGFLSTLLLVPFIGLTVATGGQLRVMALVIAVSGAISAMLMVGEARLGIDLLPAANPDDIAAWQGEVRPAGASAYNPTTASHLLLASLVLSLVLAIEDRRWRWIWAGCALICTMGLPMTGSRSAILGFGFAMLLIGWHNRRHPRFPLAVVLTVLAGLAALPFVGDAIWERFQVLAGLFDGGNTSDRTLLRRMSYNLIGWELWTRHPVTGVGPGAYPSLYAGDEFRWYPGRRAQPRQLHNSYMEVMVEMGVIGLMLFLGAVMGAAGMALKAARAGGEMAGFARAFGTAMLAFLLSSLFMPNEDNKYLWILVALCCKAAWLAGRERAAAVPAETEWQR